MSSSPDIPQMKSTKRSHKNTRIKDDFLFGVVDRFFDDEHHWNEMMSVLGKHKRGGVSLRLLDHLCNVFATQEACLVRTIDGSMAPLLEVYEASLDAYGKSHYDCFRRSKRMVLLKHGQRVNTTLGQLLFFKDIICNGVLEFARTHLERIKASMMGDNKGTSKPSSTKRNKLAPQVVPFGDEEIALFS